MEERTVISALGEIVRTLGALSLVTLQPDDPMALPEPPVPEEIAAYEAHITTITEHVDPSYQPLLAMSLRDYQAGYPDRAGAYLLEFLDKLMVEPDYAQRFSSESQGLLQFYRADLQEL